MHKLLLKTATIIPAWRFVTFPDIPSSSFILLHLSSSSCSLSLSLCVSVSVSVVVYVSLSLSLFLSSSLPLSPSLTVIFPYLPSSSLILPHLQSSFLIFPHLLSLMNAYVHCGKHESRLRSGVSIHLCYLSGLMPRSSGHLCASRMRMCRNSRMSNTSCSERSWISRS